MHTPYAYVYLCDMYTKIHIYMYMQIETDQLRSSEQAFPHEICLIYIYI